jgi:hypothetical protein
MLKRAANSLENVFLERLLGFFQERRRKKQHPSENCTVIPLGHSTPMNMIIIMSLFYYGDINFLSLGKHKSRPESGGGNF